MKLFFYWLMFLLLPTSVLAFQDDHSPATLSDSDNLKIIVSPYSYPYHFIDQNNRVAGLMVDYWQLWAEKNNRKISFIKASNWQNSLDMLEQGKADIHAAMSYTEPRNEKYGLTKALFELARYIHIHRDYPSLKTIESLEPFLVGVIANAESEHTLQRLYPNLILKPYRSTIEMYDAALKGEIIAFTGVEQIAKNYPEANKIVNLFPYSKRIQINQVGLVSAVAKNNIQLLRDIEQGKANISSAELSVIEQRWLGINSQSKALQLVYTDGVPPYMNTGPDGTPQGLFIDAWRLWSEYNQQPVEFMSGDVYQSLEMVNQRSADVHIAHPFYAQRDENLIPAYKLYQVNSYLFLKNSFDEATQLEQMSGKTVGVFKAASYRERLIAQYPEINFLDVSTSQEVVVGIREGKLDGMISAAASMQALLSEHGLLSSYHMNPAAVVKAGLYSVVNREQEALASRIQQGFDKIPLNKLTELEAQWVNKDKYHYFKELADQVQLTADEQSWFLQHGSVTVGVLKNWAPVEVLAKKGQYEGLNPDFFDLIAKRTGLSFSYRGYDNWQGLYQALLNGEVDMLGTILRTPEREEIINFSNVYLNMPWVILHQATNTARARLTDFEDKRLAVVKGYHWIKLMRERYPNIELVEVDGTEEALVALQQGRVDGILEALATATQLFYRESLMSLQISVLEELEQDAWQMGMNKKLPELKSIVDKGIATISDGERQFIYQKWLNVNVNTGLDRDVVVRLTVQVAVVIVLIIAFIIFWNRRLYIEVKRRKRLELKMKHMATHDELTGLANRVLLKERINSSINFHQRKKLNMAVLFIDLDGFKSINDTHGHDVGDELLVQLAERLKGCVRKSDTVVRFGGDEFVLLLTGLHQKEEAALVAQKALMLCQQPFELSAGSAQVGCSIGIAVYPDDGDSDNELLKVADTLMYKVKAKGKNNYTFN
ncbi:transporter substrate-binding domain-containing protein [Endozoicomonas sp. G2_1]|uniref:transporter substrate-binding domain-containing protein n=1 Tax=Endozoicomonas sp. G2_1 TaxID=2821091 RepID=UPI001ADBB1B0|nr:transporter substrate-binding domain-containing protein [Endozoicomonas sp. G2_1]MBO9491767.1 transporter substrate-binding domain-containing protein [Endozoicomonas sp. G2_1]